MMDCPNTGMNRNGWVSRAHPTRAKLPILSVLLSAWLFGLLTGCQVTDGQKIKARSEVKWSDMNGYWVPRSQKHLFVKRYE